MFFLNPKKAKANQPPTPKWFSGLMLLFFAFVMYRALYPADVPSDQRKPAGERLLDEMPSLKRVVTGETFEPATNVMEGRVEEEIIDKPVGTVPAEEPTAVEEAKPAEALDVTMDKHAPAFTIRATNGKGQPVALMYEKGANGALAFGEDASHTIILPPQNGQEMRVITIKRVD